MSADVEATLAVDVRTPIDSLVDGAIADSLIRSIRDGVNQFAVELGLPLVEEVTLQLMPLPSHIVLEVFVANQPLSYSFDLVRWLYSSVSGELADAALSPGDVLRELAVWAAASDAKAIQFCRLLCVEVIKQHPSLLLGRAQVHAYLESASGRPMQLPDGILSWMRSVLVRVVELGVSIEDRPAISAFLHENLSLSAEDAWEQLIAKYRPKWIEIRLNLQYLSELTSAGDPAVLKERFKFLRDSTFHSTGVPLPPFRFVIDESLAPKTFVFCFNHLRSFSWLGLGPKECVVGGNLEARQIMSPGYGVPVKLTTLEQTQAPGTEIWWRSLDYLIVCLMEALVNRMHFFIDRLGVEKQLSQLKRVFPVVERAVEERLSVSLLVRILRSLAAERVPILDLRRIIERLIDLDYASDRDVQISILGELPTGLFSQTGQDEQPGTLAFVRRGLAGPISLNFSLGKTVLSAYTLGADVDQLLSEIQKPQSDYNRLAEQVRSVVREELRRRPADARDVSVIVETRFRETVQRIVSDEFPRVAVLAFEEIAPEINILPIARMGLPAAR